MFVDVTAPIGALLPHQAGSVLSGIKADVKSAVPVERHLFAIVWISSDNVATGVTAFQQDPHVKHVDLITETGSEVIYQVTWGPELPSLVKCLQDADGVILSAILLDDSWSLSLRFPNRQAASRFYEDYDSSRNPLTIRRISSQVLSNHDLDSKQRVTAKQHHVLTLALKSGYFEVPRRATLTDLASELGVSDQAVSECLRRGIANALADSGVEYRDYEVNGPSPI
ncbi:helix-turn-helix domain-containing protein [Halegenticoccus soli]|uniref:helix-turn-helix domain-containing protein n=1 Tax=Halegenticoccus soli TaxID=1985678 RepID=UPI000C6E1D24|nr:helix-turn-helix domain-containing protein [Halegenticoccus soli]